MKKWIVMIILSVLVLTGCNKEERVTGYGDTQVQWAPIPGYTEEQSEGVKQELTKRIVYNPPSGDVGTVELWLDKVKEGQYLDTLIIDKEFWQKGYEFVGIDTERHIEPLEMDGNRWLAVTVRALFKQGENTFTYNGDDIEIMIPVIGEQSGKVTLGEFYTRPYQASSEMDFGGMDMTWKIFNVQMADVTHDGKEDYIVTMIVLPLEEGNVSEDAAELLKQGNVGYVQVYEGNIEPDLTSSAITRPIWEEDFASATPGHVQISVVQRNGLDYLLISEIHAQQGTYSFRYQVQALDRAGHEYIIEKEKLLFDNVDYTTYEQKLLSNEQKQQIEGFKDKISTWFEGASLVVGIEDVNLVATPEQPYVPEDIYNTIWPKYLETN